MRTQKIVLTAVAFLWVGGTAFAQSAPLRVLSSNGMKAVVEALEPQLEAAAGRPLAVEFGTTASIRKRIEAGESFDVTILAAEAVAALAQQGKVAAGTVEPFARAGVGVGARSGAAPVDVSTGASLASVLRTSRSVTWVGVGAARPHIEHLLAVLGVADEVRAKTVLASSVEEAVDSVAAGNAELVITLISEILPARGVAYAGPLPRDVQGYVSFAAGVGAASGARAAGGALIDALRAPGTAGVYESKGMELAPRSP